jgi:hypothetical protein
VIFILQKHQPHIAPTQWSNVAAYLTLKEAVAALDKLDGHRVVKLPTIGELGKILNDVQDHDS